MVIFHEKVANVKKEANEYDKEKNLRLETNGWKQICTLNFLTRYEKLKFVTLTFYLLNTK